MFHHNGPVLLLSLCALLLVCHPANGADSNWSRFRGPNGSGLSPAENLPSRWTERDYRWKLGLPAPGHASPVVWGDKVFVVCGDKTTAKRFVVCVDASKGTVSWQNEYESATSAKHRDNSYGTSTPAVDAERVYVYWTTPAEVTLLALDHSGRQAWRRSLGPFKAQHGSGTSPMAVRDLVIVNNDQEGPSSLLALDARTGATKWEVKRRTDRASYATPCIRQPDSASPELIFSSSGHGISGIDALTGKVNWELTNAFPFRVVGSPILAEGLVIGACGEGGVGRRVVAVRPPAGNAAPELVYELKNSIPYVPTPLCKAGLLFLWGDNGLVLCLRAVTGERVWERKISDSFYSSPICAGNRLYCVSKAGVVYVLAAGEKDELIAQVPLGEPSFATPAIANGAIYFRTEGHLVCLTANSP